MFDKQRLQEIFQQRSQILNTSHFDFDFEKWYDVVYPIYEKYFSEKDAENFLIFMQSQTSTILFDTNFNNELNQNLINYFDKKEAQFEEKNS